MKSTFPIFKAGNYGKKGTFSAEDVKEIFEKYDPDFLSAPFTVDHKQDGPAFGYARNLNFEDDTLFASAGDLADVMKSAVKEKHFNRVSIELFKDLPEKGRYLKAISFLGVKAPAVKGFEGEIAKTEFEDAETETIEFSVDWDDEAFTLSFSDEEKEPDEKDKKPPFKSGDSDSFEELQAKYNQLEAEKNTLTQKFEASETEKKQARERLQEIELNQRRLSFEQWLNDFVAFRSITPKNKQKVMNILLALDSIEMFEAEGEEFNPVTVFQEVMDDMPEVLDPEEKAIKGDNFEAPSEAEEIAIAAKKHQKEIFEDTGKMISTAEAVTFVTKNKR